MTVEHKLIPVFMLNTSLNEKHPSLIIVKSGLERKSVFISLSGKALHSLINLVKEFN